MEPVGTAWRPTWASRADQWLTGVRMSTLLPFASSWLVLAVIVALSLFVLYMTFVPDLPTEGGLTLDHWISVASSPRLAKVIQNTTILGFGTVLVVAFFALPIAWLLNRTTVPFSDTLLTLIAAVAIVPGYVKAMGWIILLNDRIGVFNQMIAGLLGLHTVPLSVMNNPFGMVWVTGLMLTPVMVFLVSGPLRTLDPALEEAASTAGLRYWRLILKVSLPLVWPAILGALIYIFMMAVSIFEVPALLGGSSGRVPVLSTELFYAVRPTGFVTITYGAAGVYSVFLALPSLVAMYFYLRVLAKADRYGVITGKGYRPRNIDLGRFKWLGLAFVVIYMSLAVLLPILMLLWVSLLPVFRMPSSQVFSLVSFANYWDFLSAVGGIGVIRNTALLVISVSFLVLFFSLMTSWIVLRTRSRLRKVMDIIAMLPIAIPDLAFAFALGILAIVASRWLPWLPLEGTLGIIVIAHVVNRLSFGTRITNAALMQVHHELEECAQVCGTADLTIMRRITLPLIKSSLIFAGLYTALLSLREVTMALFLSGPQNVVLSVSIWQLWEGGRVGTAAAGAVMTVAITALLMLLILKLTGGRVTSRLGVWARAPVNIK